MPTKPQGRPPLPASKVNRRKGRPRFSIEMDVTLLRRVDVASKSSGQSRNAEIACLLEEALDARQAAPS